MDLWIHRIEEAFNNISSIQSDKIDPELKNILDQVLDLLDTGKLRIAEKKDQQWIVHEWLKKAILLVFKIKQNQVFEGNFTQFFDKIPLKYAQHMASSFQKEGVRVVPGAYVRKGAYIAPQTVLMPSYVNIGAYVDSGCLIDTWSTIGSCAQIGKNVHISGGVGIGGVLEPIQNKPTIIEDNCFIGARSEIAEGVLIEEGSVIGMGVYLGQSTRVYNRFSGETFYGRIPAGSVVVPGSIPSADGKYNLYSAIIVKQVDAKTRAKTSLNQLLREGIGEE